jgi:hypothetical protein
VAQALDGVAEARPEVAVVAVAVLEGEEVRDEQPLEVPSMTAGAVRVKLAAYARGVGSTPVRLSLP